MSGNNANLVSFDENVQAALNDVAQEIGFTKYSFKSVPGCEKGDGYIGVISSVKITGSDEEGDGKTVNVIVKSAPKSDALRAQLLVPALFKKEMYMYETVFPTFAKIEKEKGLKPTKFNPYLYKGGQVDQKEFIILEDLKASGYVLHNRKKSMDVDHIKLVLTQYGRFHALSFALKDQNPDLFQGISKSLPDDFAADDLQLHFISSFTQQCCKAKAALDPIKHQLPLETFQQFIDSIDKFYRGLSKVTEKYSVVLHGDCWNSNMMFKYKDEAPTDVCFFDFQVSKMGSPVLDLAYFIYTCCDEEVLENIDEYLRLYHTSFSSYLRELGSDPVKMYPYSAFQEEWQRLGKYGLLISLLIIHLALTQGEETIDLTNETESGNTVANALGYEISGLELYKERVRPIIMHFVERKLI